MNTKKPFFALKIISIILIGIIAISCSNNDDSDGGDDNPQGDNFIEYTISGSAASNLNGVFRIDVPDNDETGASMILGHVYEEDTNEGTVKVVNLTFSYFASDDNYYDVTMKLPAVTGSRTLGEFETTSTGIISFEPTYNMVLSFDSNRAFYDADNNGSNDILTDLLSKNVVVSITEYEETTNSLGITTVAHIKGSIGQSGNQFLFKTFTGPTSPPGDSFCNVTVDFEYTLTE
ncbi:hypothetical protein M0G43_09295 [Subsaxibacter sp. CAU 1640]|uniref:hypothetical protein n=1 Tax=Subsaxibacter sp. CAU 1640 TaxID=2933271 RepID=UPI002005C14C|nr:hypothetical protein [Subsaxibacter sp. CAU 1640]MCK7590768.1 hypothetical protein [Subsaxibacter sp. CAU 1640]